MKSTEHEAFFKEAQETAGRIAAENRRLKELEWFLDTALVRFYDKYLRNRNPQVIVLGDDIPAEWLYAVCDRPFYVLGGSLGTAHWADELTPRDTDPFSRSCLGWLMNPSFDLTKDALIVTAVSSDSRRKLISLLRSAGKKVAALDIPPAGLTGGAVGCYRDQLAALAETVGRHTGRRLTGSRLRRAVRRMDRARRMRQRFLAAAEGADSLITGEAALLVGQCLYFAEDPDEWTAHAERLCAELKALFGRFAFPKKDRPTVMLLGSPAVFPNYKVPQLISAAGMRLAAAADSLSLEADLSLPENAGRLSRDRLLSHIARVHLQTTSTGARVSNDGLYSYFRYLKERYRPDGIVCHILKGQIEFDFELPRIEKAAEKAGIPVFRLETDYQYQDMEQLRIRMEAFGEMLAQRNLSGRSNKKTA